jgi:hypothetical protein
MKLELPHQIFERKKSSTMKFYENPSSDSTAVPCGRTDMTKMILLISILQMRLKTDQSMLYRVKAFLCSDKHINALRGQKQNAAFLKGVFALLGSERVKQYP